MPPDSPDQPEIEAIMAQAAEDHARFVTESNEIDRAWASGTLDDWVGDKLKQLGGLDDGDSGNSGPSEPSP
jgi:hypothetical protein